MIDVITYVSDLEAFRAELINSGSDYVDENGKFTVTMTPVRKNGNESVALLRVPSADLVSAFPSLQVLASAPAGGIAAFTELFKDESATAIYDRVYDQTPVTFTDDEGTEHTHTPPRVFGVFA